jgi:hypothetical protein
LAAAAREGVPLIHRLHRSAAISWKSNAADIVAIAKCPPLLGVPSESVIEGAVELKIHVKRVAVARFDRPVVLDALKEAKLRWNGGETAIEYGLVLDIASRAIATNHRHSHIHCRRQHRVERRRGAIKRSVTTLADDGRPSRARGWGLGSQRDERRREECVHFGAFVVSEVLTALHSIECMQPPACIDKPPRGARLRLRRVNILFFAAPSLAVNRRVLRFFSAADPPVLKLL